MARKQPPGRREEAAAEGASRRGERATRGGGPLARLLVALAVVMMVAGVAIGVMFGTDASPPPPAPPRYPPPAAQTQPAPAEPGGEIDRPAGFLPESRPGSAGSESNPPAPRAPHASEAPAPENMWSTALFRLGFSFFIGFAIAFALRAFIKLSLVAVGFFALVLFGMQYAGFIDVNWTLLGDRYESAGDWVGGQFKTFRAFITGELPSAAGVLGGLALGFRSRL
jgi:uncharacterized membrane protein (Fun14 family)